MVWQAAATAAVIVMVAVAVTAASAVPKPKNEENLQRNPILFHKKQRLQQFLKLIFHGLMETLLIMY